LSLLGRALRALRRRVLGRAAPSWEPDRQPWPWVSAIVPPGLDLDRLVDTVRGALDGPYDRLELLIVDPRASDGPDPGLRRLTTTPRVRVVRPPALAHAVRVARGEFVAWLSGEGDGGVGGIPALVAALRRHPQTEVTRADSGPGFGGRRDALRVLAHHLGGGPSAAFWRAVARLEATPVDPGAPMWALVADPSLAAADRLALESLAGTLPAVVEPPGRDAASGPGRLRVTGAGGTAKEPIYVQALAHGWRLAWDGLPAGHGELDAWRGVAVSVRAREARGAGRAAARRRLVVGCHLGLAEAAIDVAAFRVTVAKNPELVFLVIDAAGRDAPERGRELVAGHANARYAGPVALGDAVDLYATFDVVWLPRRAAEAGARGPIDDAYRTSLALAYAIGRPFVGPRDLPFTAAPYQHGYHPDESLRFVGRLDRAALDVAVLDRYLESWTPAASFRRLLRHADALTTDEGTPAAPIGVPVRATSATAEERRTGRRAPVARVLLAAETLDTGGLEAMVAQLAGRLPRLGTDAAVLCVTDGGATAGRLQASGVRVHVAERDRRRLREVLAQEAPAVVHSHLAGLPLLESAWELGIPVVETVHNTYVWFDRAGWQEEARRSRYFARAAAVSALVHAYYAKWNPAYPAEWTAVLPNGVDLDRLALVDRVQARRQLGIAEDDMLFLTLASYAPQKNQLGLLAAFDETARRHSGVRLLCAGATGDGPYYQHVIRYRRTLRTQDRIELHPLRHDVARLLSAADVFVLDSFFEGWSVAATEALAAGVPLIHTECGSARELVGEAGERGIVVPNPAADVLDLTWERLAPLVWTARQRNTAALVEAMSRMVDDRGAWRRRAGEIRAHASAHFGYDACAGRYQALYDAVVTGQSALPPGGSGSA
jgi:glycosyltransferase involved in cell wall biosynthesis